MVNHMLRILFVGVVSLTAIGLTPRVRSDDFEFYVDPEADFMEQSPSAASETLVHGPSASFHREYGLSLVCNSYLMSRTGESYNLAMEAHLYRPDDVPFGSGSNGAYKPSVYIDARGFDPNPVSGQYRCVTDNYVEGQLVGQSISTINVVVIVPSYLTAVEDGYLYQNFDDYNREIHYQIKNQLDNDLTIAGLSVAESYSLVSNSCNRGEIQTSSTSSNSQGRFKDNYWVNGSGTPGCQHNAACTTVATQAIRVANILVRTNEVTFACTSVTILPQ